MGKEGKEMKKERREESRNQHRNERIAKEAWKCRKAVVSCKDPRHLRRQKTCRDAWQAMESEEAFSIQP